MYLQSLILYPVVDMSHTTKINFNSLTGSFYLCIFSHSIPRGWYVPYNKNRFQFFDWIFLFMYLQSLILYPVVDMSHTTKINFNSLTGSFYLCIFSHSIPRGWYVPYNKNRFQFFDWIFLFMYLQSLILYPVVDMSHTTKINFNSLTGSFYLCIFSHSIPRGWYVPYNKNRFQFFDWIFLFMYLQSLILYPVVDMSHTTKINFNSLTGSFYLCIFSH